MKNVISYLTFNGNCKEAMEFYKECIGGELSFQTIGESSMADKMPEKMRNSILHATLTIGNVVIMATDMTPQSGLVKGNNISLMLDCDTQEEIETFYKKLQVEGFSDHPLENTFWGAVFGDVTDKYGNHWLLHFNKNNF